MGEPRTTFLITSFIVPYGICADVDVDVDIDVDGLPPPTRSLRAFRPGVHNPESTGT